jgi:multidrug transporter EmrE-like cation transporter
MSLPQIFALSAVEIVGDVAFKSFANDKGAVYLGIGVGAYTIMMGLLVIALQNSSILMVNNGWDAINGILESLFAYFVLGERFEHYTQYLGVMFIVLGMYLMDIPWKKNKPFHIPKFF